MPQALTAVWSGEEGRKNMVAANIDLNSHICREEKKSVKNV